jgi:hypothetical protein
MPWPGDPDKAATTMVAIMAQDTVKVAGSDQVIDTPLIKNKTKRQAKAIPEVY